MAMNSKLESYLHFKASNTIQSKRKTFSLLVLAVLVSAHPSISQSVASNESGVPRPASSTQPSQKAPQVKLRLTETVSSATARVGQPISLEVVEPVEVGGKLVVAVGAHASATVSVARQRGHNRREGKLLLTVQSVSRVDGTEAQLHSPSLNKGSGVGSPIFGPCTFPIPADPVGLFRKGHDVVIPKGTELVATLASDTP
jgi:hypothetical protein